MSNDSKLPTVLLLMLMGIVILLMVAIVGLFIHMNQLQHEVLVALSGGMTEQEVGLEIGIQAPSFTLPDTTGSMVSLEDFAGQRVLLGFSSTHCPACARMYPHLRALGESRDDVQVVMISQGSV